MIWTHTCPEDALPNYTLIVAAISDPLHELPPCILVLSIKWQNVLQFKVHMVGVELSDFSRKVQGRNCMHAGTNIFIHGSYRVVNYTYRSYRVVNYVIE